MTGAVGKDPLARARALNTIAAVDEGASFREGAPSVLVKDNIAVAGLPWTAGSPVFARLVAGCDAMAARRRRCVARLCGRTWQLLP